MSEQFKPRKIEKELGREQNEGILPVGLTLKASIAALSIVSATPAFSQEQRAPMERPGQTIVIDVNALKAMAGRIQMQLQSPETRAVAVDAANQAAKIGVEAAAEIAKPAIDELISGLTQFRRSLDAGKK